MPAHRPGHRPGSQAGAPRSEMIEAAGQAQELTSGVTASELDADRQRRDALLWNFTVLGEAAGQLSDDIKTRFPEVSADFRDL